jgi:hypothetical protein
VGGRSRRGMTGGGRRPICRRCRSNDHGGTVVGGTGESREGEREYLARCEE